MVKIGFIGTDVMGLAIISSISNTKLPVRFMAYDAEEKNYPILQKKGVVFCASPAEVAKRCDYTILAMDSGNYAEILEELQPVASSIGVLISLNTEFSEFDICRILAYEAKVILAAPNMPIVIQQGTTILVAGKNVQAYELDFVRSLFSMCGEVAIVKPEQLDVLFPLTETSPALILLFAKGFVEYAAKHGVSSESAKDLIAHVLKGTADMLLESQLSIERWIASTAASHKAIKNNLTYFEEQKFESLVEEGCEACYRMRQEEK